jgi:hypothetical protein
LADAADVAAEDVRRAGLATTICTVAEAWVSIDGSGPTLLGSRLMQQAAERRENSQ